MPVPLIAAGVAAAGTIGGAVLSSSSQRHAASTAANAEIAAANQNAMLARQFRQDNQANFQPNLNSGTRANSLLDAFLYGPQNGPNANTPDLNGYLQANPDILNDYNAHVDHQQFATPEAYAQWHYQHYGQGEGRQLPTVGGQQNAMLDAYKSFEASPYYQTPLREGMRQLNTGLASHGEIKSGDAMKGAGRYGQDYASGRMGDFLGLAENQVNRGVQAGGAIAGVGLNALNNQTASNNAVGQANANRAIAGGVANANMFSGIGSALGTFAGSAFAPSTSAYRF